MSTRRTFQDLSDEEIRNLVRSLSSLQEGELGISMLVACGERAIPPLRESLISGRPTTVPEPRQRAVRALVELGAREVLLEYLHAARKIADPVVRLAEEAVENTAARALANWQTEEVFQALLDIAGTRSLPGAIEGLSAFQRSEAVPVFLSALGDDFARAAAEDGLRTLGERAVPALIEAARTPDPSRESESPSSLSRRRRSARILADRKLEPDVWQKLQALLWDADYGIATAASRIALQIGAEDDRRIAVGRMSEALEHVDDWLTAIEIGDALAEHFEDVRPYIEATLRERSATLSAEKRVLDPVVNVLNRARLRAVASTRES